LWDDARLEMAPSTHLADIAIVTSFRNSSITVKGALDGPDRSGSVSAVVLDQGKNFMELGSSAAGGEGWTIQAPFKNVFAWSPENPYLYTLLVTLKNARGETVDAWSRKFGFRELWTE